MAIVTRTGKGSPLTTQELDNNWIELSEKQESLGWLNIKKAFNAKGDGVILEGAASITSGSATLTVTGASFTSADIGKSFILHGAGSGAVALRGTITAVTSATVCTLSASASSTVSAQYFAYGTDDTNAIQAAVDYVSNSSTKDTTLYAPNGVYMLAGALKTSVNSVNPNCQIVLGTQALSEAQTLIKFKGESSPRLLLGVLAERPLITTGVMFYSTITGSGTLPSVFGGRAGTSDVSPNFTQVFAKMEDVRVRTHFNLGTGSKGTSMTALKLQHINHCELDTVYVDTDVRGWNIVQPAGNDSTTGIAMPARDAGLYAVARNCNVLGYHIGFTVSDHTLIENCAAHLCNAAIVVLRAHHPALVTKFHAHWNRNHIVAAGNYGAGEVYHPDEAGSSIITIDQFALEHNNPSTYPGRWWATLWSLRDPSNNILGDISYSTVLGSVGQNDNFPVSGGANVYYRRIGTKPATSSTTTYVSDLFNDANGVNITSRLPSVGSSWIQHTTQSAAFTTDGTGKAVSSGAGIVTQNTSSPNGVITLKLKGTLATSAEVLIRARNSASQPTIAAVVNCSLKNNAGTLNVQMTEVNASATVQTTSIATLALVADPVMKVTMNGNAITFTVNNTSVSLTVSTGQSNTIHGIQTTVSGIGLDEYSFASA
jgi:hypothetical protein